MPDPARHFEGLAKVATLIGAEIEAAADLCQGGLDPLHEDLVAASIAAGIAQIQLAIKPFQLLALDLELAAAAKASGK